MADSDIILQFVYSSDAGVDMRTFRVLQVLGDAADELELYKVLSFAYVLFAWTLSRPFLVFPPINGSFYGHDDLSS